MRQWVIGFSLLVPIIVAHSGVAQDSAEPPAPGAYYKAKGGWQKLEELQRTDFKANVFSGAVLSYRGSEAPLQLSDRRPVFYIKTTPGNEGLITDASLNTVIVLLSRKQDHRELKVAK